MGRRKPKELRPDYHGLMAENAELRNRVEELSVQLFQHTVRSAVITVQRVIEHMAALRTARFAAAKAERETQEAHRAAFERWMKAQQAVQLADTGRRAFVAEQLPECPPNVETVVLTKEHLIRFRAGYQLAVNALADLLGKPPQEMTQLDAIVSLAQSHAEEGADGPVDDG